MIRHIVLVRFGAHVDADQRAALFADLADLCEQIPGIVDFRCGRNISPEAAVIHGFEHGFWFDFDDAATRDAYLAAPAHIAIGRRLLAACADGTDGLIVFEIEV
jgi:hypothetical protein